MLATVSLAALSSAASFAHRACDPKSPGIQGSLLISAQHDALSFTGSSALGSSRATCGATVEFPRKVAVHAAAFMASLSAVGPGHVTILVNDRHRVILRSGRRKVELAGEPGDDFPDLPPQPTGAVVSVGALTLGEALLRVRYACGDDEFRAYTMGVLLGVRRGSSGSPTGTCLVASDGKRMAMSDLELSETPADSLLIPSRAVSVVSSIASENPLAEIRISVDDTRVWCVTPGRTTVVPRIVAEPLAWQSYYERVRVDSTSSAVVKQAEAYDAFTSVSRVREAVEPCAVSLEQDNGSSVLMLRLAGGRGSCEIPIPVLQYAAPNSPDAFLVNPRYVADGIGHVGDDTVTLRWRDPESPLMVEGGNDRAVIMTMR